VYEQLPVPRTEMLTVAGAVAGFGVISRPLRRALGAGGAGAGSIRTVVVAWPSQFPIPRATTV